MNKREKLESTMMLDNLRRIGIDRQDLQPLRRISMTLRRWFELECGTGTMDYSGLTKEDTAQLNNWLLANGLSFVDCLDCSEQYMGRFNGLLCTVCDYTYKA